MTDIQALSDHVAAGLGDALVSRIVAFGELTIVVERARIVEALTWLRDDPGCRFVNFTDLCGADSWARAAVRRRLPPALAAP